MSNGTQVDFDKVSLSAVVPEPEEYAMLLLGMPLIAWVARRKQVTETVTA
jgi:hypothetical protein